MCVLKHLNVIACAVPCYSAGVFLLLTLQSWKVEVRWSVTKQVSATEWVRKFQVPVYILNWKQFPHCWRRFRIFALIYAIATNFSATLSERTSLISNEFCSTGNCTNIRTPVVYIVQDVACIFTILYQCSICWFW